MLDYVDLREEEDRDTTQLMAMNFPPTFNEQASLIYLNLGQTLLVRQSDARCKQYLGLGAAQVIPKGTTQYLDRNRRLAFERHKQAILLFFNESVNASH